MTMDERWVKRTPLEMFRTFHGFHGQGFNASWKNPRGPANRCARFGRRVQASASPHCPIAEPTRSGSMAASYSFISADFLPSAWLILEHCRTNKRSADGPSYLLARDALYTEEVEKQAATLQLTRIQVNGSVSADELATRVAQCLGLKRQ